MQGYTDLLDTLVRQVHEMRHWQRQRTPGAPKSIRDAAARCEEEVDALIALHMLPPVTDTTPPEVQS